MQISGKVMKRNLFLQAKNFFDLIAVENYYDHYKLEEKEELI